MADFKAHIDTFPLEHLFQRLQLAGFRLSPGDRLRALRVLGGPGKAYLQDPAQLKALLGPVLARSEAEQLKFYEVFDQYYREITAPLELEESKPKSSDWWRWLLIIPLLAGLWYAFYQLRQQNVHQETLSVYIDGPEAGVAGDTVIFKNLSRYSGDSSQLSWRWSYVNLATQQEEAFDTTHFDWQLVVPTLDSGSYLREVRLAVHQPSEDTIYQTTLPFSVLCSSTPTVTGIEGPRQLVADEEAVFRAALDSTQWEATVDPTVNWEFTWNFGDGTQVVGTNSIRHQYRQNGQYQVQLTVKDTSATGYCTVTRSLSVKVGVDKAYLPLYALEKDQLSLIATWGWGFYLLLGLLGVSLLYYWIRWLVQRRQETPEQQQEVHDKKLLARFAHSDKAPYFIPLRDPSAFIQFPSTQLRLADALRLRQQGFRKEMDVANTLQATIEGGGYPAIRFRFASQPSEYLCLLDEQARASHQGALLKNLVKNLREQDVNLEVYYYRKHLSQFWNAYFPQGRTLDQLQRAYPNHRLLIFGDLHELIDPHAAGQPRVRLGPAAVLRRWPLRLLLTPVPPVSWSYREKLLGRVFNLFAVDSAGLAAAALHLENGEELLPDGASFDRYRARQQEQRADADTEHRNWRRWRYVKEYLSSYDQDLVRWFKALTVFPLPSWEMTIAIGRALGLNVTYDRLLVLARIPALQSDRFDERLRRELFQELSAADEQTARQAVQAELSAVKTLSVGSHAHRELETALAIQDFALAPEHEEHRETLRFLLRSNLLTPAQEAELDRVATRADQAQEETGSKVFTKSAPVSRSVRDWLEEDVDYELDAPSRKTPSDRKNLYRALGLTAAYVVLLFLGWQLGATDFLYELVFAETPAQSAARSEEGLRDYFLVKETAVIDSAIIYNNQGVEQARIEEDRDTLAAIYFKQALGAANALIHGKGEKFNDETVPYSLANANLGRLYFNAAAASLNAYHQDSVGREALAPALDLLTQAYISDSVALDVLHARGVVHYYLSSNTEDDLFAILTGDVFVNHFDSVRYYYQLLDSLDYFTSLAYTPNLQTLFGEEPTRIAAVKITDLGNQVLQVDVDYAFQIRDGDQAEVFVRTRGEGNQPDLQATAVSPGQSALSFRLEPPRRSPGMMDHILVGIRLDAQSDVISSIGKTYEHDWAAREERQDVTAQQQQTVAEPSNSFVLRGQVLDANSKEPVAQSTITLSESPNRVSRELLMFTGEMTPKGAFTVRGDLQDHTARTFTLRVEATGYETFTRAFQSGNELLRSKSYNLEPILLEKNIARPRMERVSGGGFTMGNDGKGALEDERPSHEVQVGNFYVGIHEVTFTEYDVFCERTARSKPDDEGWGRGTRPVINISWLDAVEYCNWLSEQHGYEPVYELNPKQGTATLRSTKGGVPNGYRLPTEAEWEYAARGGIMGDKSQVFAGSNDLSEVGWYERNSKDQTHPVGQLKPNNAGTFDMSGNVWEWCFDWYGEYPSTSQREPIGPSYGSHRIIRGGAWLQADDDCRVFTRQYRRPDEKTVYIGFRLVRN